MQTAAEFEQQSLTAWVMQEFRDMITGFRETLEPLIPRLEPAFNMLDAQIAAFMADGHTEQLRLQELIESKPDQETEPAPNPDQTMIAESVEPSTAIAFYGPIDAPVDYIPEVEFFTPDGFLLDLDTSKGINLPDLTITPIDGGIYESELTILQPALDTVQFLQDQVPSPIQTVGNELYNRLTGLPDAERGTA